MTTVKTTLKTVSWYNLRYFLDLRGLSCQELEDKCHLERGTLAMHGPGNKLTLPPETVQKVAEILEIPVEHLRLFPCKNIKYYCDARDLPISHLENRCGMHNNLSEAIYGGQKTMSYEKISKVAKVLCVDIDDLGAPKNQRIDIQKITKEILMAFLKDPVSPSKDDSSLSKAKFPAFLLKRKSETVVFFLSMSQEEETLKACIHYIIYKSNYLGRSLACFLLASSDQDFMDFGLDFSNAITVLEQFRKQQNSLQKEDKLTHQVLADKLGITRQTLAKYLNGKSIPDYDLIWRLASVLNIEYPLLVQDYHPSPACLEQVKQDIESAIQTTKPKVLKEREGLILDYLEHRDVDMERLLAYLSLPSPTKKEKAIETLQDMMKLPLFYQEHYKPHIQIRYSQEEEGFYNASVLLDVDELEQNQSFLKLLRDLLSNPSLTAWLSDEKFLDGLLSALDETLSQLDGDLPLINKNLSYKVFLKNILSDQQILNVITSDDFKKKKELLNEILLKNTIYPVFQLPSPFQYLPSENPTDFPREYMDFPYQIETDLSPEDDDFESEFSELAIQAFMEDVSGSMISTYLADVLSGYFDEYSQYVDIVEYT